MDRDVSQSFASLAGLYQEETACEKEYRRMAAALPGHGACFSALARCCSRGAACITGVLVLQTGQSPCPVPPKKERLPLRSALLKCLGRELRCLKGYQYWEEDPEFGPVYACLAREKGEQCCRLLALAGALLDNQEPFCKGS